MMKQAIVRLTILICCYSVICGVVGSPYLLYALPTIEDLFASGERLEVPVNKSQLVVSKAFVTRVSVVAPDVADVQILDPQQILVSGKSVGHTSLVIWAEDGITRTIEVVVNWDTYQIRQALQKILPGQAIEVVPLEDAVVLRGAVTDIGMADQAMQISQSFVPKVINMLTVPGEHQVLLKVRIAEIARSFRREKGIDFVKHFEDSFRVGSRVNRLTTLDPLGGYPTSISDSVTLFLSLPDEELWGFIQALEQEGLMRMLAEPNLIARSGETASFLAGGQFPVPVTQGGAVAGAITIEYKEYGVRLNFTPTVVSEKTIHLKIAPEVSDLDFAQGIQIQGFIIPVIVTRRAQTVVKLEDGQTFAIAGLISQQREKTNRRLPPFGNLPVVGGLFRGRELRAQETELLIMVTPHLIAPLESGRTYKMPGEDTESGESEISVKLRSAEGGGKRETQQTTSKGNVREEYPVRVREEIAYQARRRAQPGSHRRRNFGPAVSHEQILSGKGVIVTQR